MRRCTKIILLGALFLFSTLVIGDETKLIYLFKGGVKVNPGKVITKKDLAVEPAQGKFFSQSWTFVYYLDDGGGGYIQFSSARFGYTIKNILVHHSHYTAEGKLVYRKEILSANDIKWDEKEPKLSMGNSSWTGFYPEFHLVIPLPGLETDLIFQCLTPPWRPGEGPVHYGSKEGDWYDVVIPIPLARVSGTIKAEGKEKKVSGFGYCDHNTQTVWFMTQCEELYALRSFSPNWAIHFLDYHSPAAFGYKRMSWLIVIKQGKIIYATDDYKIEPSDWAKEPKRGRKYPQKARIIIDSPEILLEGDIKGLKLLDVLDVRDETPKWAEPVLSKLIREPAFLREKAEVSWKINFQGKEEIIPAQGIFEYTIVEKD